ncbi:sodium:alanine symporter family protein [Clostridiaceae bacterium HSG29]|nr:sodium:alanine symporter family protein [Clostridiaceae bacterium HSG29]
MNVIENYVKFLADLVWGDWLLFTLIGVGLYFTIITRGIQIRKFRFAINESLIKPFKKDNKINGVGTLTPFQSFTTALASCVGNGNIVGVATALVYGGPGALFWMWVAAFVGMATKYAEILLGMVYRVKGDDGIYVGGPMYYIEKGLKIKWLAKVFSVLLIIQICGGNLIQSNAVAGVFEDIFHLPKISAAFFLSFAVGLVIIGGIKKLGAFAEKLVPFMSILYIIGGLIVILINISIIPQTIILIFKSAFSVKAGVAGAIGYTIKQALRYGVTRGLYSNEAGEGSAPVLHSSAITDHPVRQALFGITEVFIDTGIICTITGFTVLTSGISLLDSPPGTLTSLAFSTVHPFMQYFVGIAMILFAFTSIPAQWYFGQVGLTHLVGANKTQWFKYFFVCFTFFGSLISFKLVWYLQDFILGILIIPNLIAILLLSKVVTEYTNDFFKPEIERKYNFK